MIHKLISIKNLGKYRNFSISRDSDWNGIFDSINAIYAENASGKTTFTQIFKSLKNDDEILLKRKTFNSEEDIEITFFNKEGKQINYNKNKWNYKVNDIEVFDSYFIEENVYLITIGNYDREGNLFQLVMGNEAKTLYNKIVSLTKSRKIHSTKKRNLKNKIKNALKDNSPEDKVKGLNNAIRKKEQLVISLNEEIKVLETKLFELAENFGVNYLDKINYYLSFLNPNITLTKLNKKGSNFIYYIKIQDHDVRSDSESIPLKHTLSEGDKSSLALAFFFARITLNDDLKNKLIVFDDPISSFDLNRRHITINLLNKISKEAKQFILLSHDINFVKDFSNKVDSCLNLKIIYNGNSSIIKHQDIKNDTLTGIFKDLTIIKNYLEKGDDSEFDKREIIRCIRPVIEGFFRIKFFGYINDTQWLGDIISLIRESDEGSMYNRYKMFLDDIIDINDYTKSYHHSSPNYLEIPINSNELRNYSNRTLQLLNKI
ncbi:MAG: hypothetical protein E6Q46_06695 [Flavobacterium sp.]|nr:MAG: hypothetical protein E6Q46_06695 [Flavobacterium sp.]